MSRNFIIILSLFLFPISSFALTIPYYTYSEFQTGLKFHRDAYIGISGVNVNFTGIQSGSRGIYQFGVSTGSGTLGTCINKGISPVNVTNESYSVRAPASNGTYSVWFKGSTGTTANCSSGLSNAQSIGTITVTDTVPLSMSSTPVVWLSHDALGASYSSGASVALWANRVNSSANFNRKSTSNYPTYQNTGIIFTSPSNNNLTPQPNTVASPTANMTVFVALNINTISNSDSCNLVAQRKDTDTSPGSNGWSITYFNSSKTFQASYFKGGSYTLSSTALSAAGNYIVVFRSSSSSGSAFFINGASAGSRTDTASNFTWSGNVIYNIGGFCSGTSGLQMSIREVIGYNAALSDLEIKQITGYLNAKWIFY